MTAPPAPVEHVGGCNPGCHGDDHLLLADETPAGGHDSGAVFVSSPVEREVAPVPPAGPPSPEQVHRDALADTGDAYRQFYGWVLECLWCEFEAVGKSKAEALRNMQRHYDAVLPEGATLR